MQPSPSTNSNNDPSSTSVGGGNNNINSNNGGVDSSSYDPELLNNSNNDGNGEKGSLLLLSLNPGGDGNSIGGVLSFAAEGRTLRRSLAIIAGIAILSWFFGPTRHG
jgi:hypothetical protein